jgi:surface protein
VQNKISNKKKKGRLETGFGSGCFIHLDKEDIPLKKFLLTNNHVLDEARIKGDKELDILYNGKIKKINLSKRKRYTDEDIDYTCIEIFDEDNIEQFYYIDPRVFKNDPSLFFGEDIFVLHYPKGGDLSFSLGKIKDVKNSKIYHDCSTEEGSSGSPVVSRYNLSIIGLHYGTKHEYNCAKGISFILNDIKIKCNNFIIAEFEIDKENINKEFRIINSFENSKLEFKMSDKNINPNEKEIKDNCIIEVNNKPIPFSYNYKHSKEERIIIKYTFLNYLNNINSMFRGCYLLKSIDLSNFKSKQVNNMNFLFSNNYSLKRIVFSNLTTYFTTENVTDMNGMFNGCNNLTELDLLKFNTAKVTNMSYMFAYCKTLSNLDLSSFNTEKVVDMSWMFYDCRKLEKLDLSHFNTNKVKDMSYMFCGCKNIFKIKLSSFNTENVKTMNTMFGGCEYIQDLDLSNFKTYNCEDMLWMFSGCHRLMSLNIIGFSTESLRNKNLTGGMFSSLNYLLSMYLTVKDQNIIDEYNMEVENNYLAK